MKILILGAGRVGRSVAESLVSDANDITVVDTSQERIQMLQDRFDLLGIVGDACSPSVLSSAGAMDADLLIAVNRPYGKSDYIPCITWGRNAKYTENLPVGTNVKIWGRIQSREYKKKISEEEFITKTAYEVSVTKMETVDECQ